MRGLSLFVALFFGVVAWSAGMEKSSRSPVPFEKGDSIETMAEYRELEGTLKQAAALGHGQSLYSLGLLYAAPLTLEDGTIVPADPEKAREYLQKALEAGIGMAAYNLAALETKDGNPAGALYVIDRAYRTSRLSEGERSLLAVRFGATVLDYFPGDRVATNRAIARLEEIVRSRGRSLPTAAFVLAHLYLAEGNVSVANVYLNAACSNPSVSDDLKNLCFNSEGIEAKEKKR